MTKIMLVEDDKNLRDIYGVRLFAEGYDIVSAGDGEEALAMAIKERPGLIVSDVMMPKISGFDMLDILRSTTETKNIKVIMMTALSSDQQRQRGESLGADRYIVKSQVGIEDVVRIVHEVLGDGVAAAPAPTAPQQFTPQPAQPQPASGIPSFNPNQSVAPAPPAASAPQPQFQPPQPQPTPQPVQPQPMHSSVSPSAPSARNRVIQPIESSGVDQVDINELLNKELAKEAGIGPLDQPPGVTSTDQPAPPNPASVAPEQSAPPQFAPPMQQMQAPTQPQPPVSMPTPTINLPQQPSQPQPPFNPPAPGAQ